MLRPVLSGEPREVPGWFGLTRKQLLDAWSKKTGHGVESSDGWARELTDSCRTSTNHFSVPCSLAIEADEIGQLLNVDWATEAFPLFFRCYLMTLSEFVGGLESVANLLGLRVGKPPRNVLSWCNNFAKHRLCILIQHHPGIVVADAYGAAWAEFSRTLSNEVLTFASGKVRTIQIIDQKWFDRKRSLDIAAANSGPQAMIVVPPLIEFLEGTMLYFRAVIDSCLNAPDLVKQFESSNHPAR